MDTTGFCTHYLSPVNAVMASQHGLYLDLSSTGRWRANVSASSKQPNRLCSSYDGKHMVSRLKSMLPRVARFILSHGTATIWAELQAARAGEAEKSPTKKPLSVNAMRCHFYPLHICLPFRAVEKSVVLTARLSAAGAKAIPYVLRLQQIDKNTSEESPGVCEPRSECERCHRHASGSRLTSGVYEPEVATFVGILNT